MIVETFISEEYRDSIENFTCTDEPSVEIFLKEYALKYHQNNLAKTRLYFNENRELIGYFTLFTDYITVPKSKRNQNQWKLTSVHGKQMYPAIRLHYLGIDEKFRSQGFGKILLFFAIDICKDIAEEIGCVFLSIEALNNSVDFYKKFHFKLLNKQDQYLTNMIFKIDEIDSV